jgi:hypothetical protein
MEYGWDLPEYYNFYNGKSELRILAKSGQSF